MSGPDLSIEFLGLRFKNPFLLASAPPTRRPEMISRAFSHGWAGAVIKTIAPSLPFQFRPRLAKVKARNRLGSLANIDASSDLPLKVWEEEIPRIKERFPDQPVFGSLTAGQDQADWQELATRLEQAGVDALEIMISCPQGRATIGEVSGARVGQDPAEAGQVVAWVREVTTIPLLVKMTGHAWDLLEVAEQCYKEGAQGFSAINTLAGMVGVDIENLKPLLDVRGRTIFAGISGAAIKPLALKAVCELAGRYPVSGVGGIETWQDAVEFMLLGASSVQLGTQVMLSGYGIIHRLKKGLSQYLTRKGFRSVQEIIGLSRQMVVSYPQLRRQEEEEKPRSAWVNEGCNGCGRCQISCYDAANQAITMRNGLAWVDKERCIGCGLCAVVCPVDAVRMVES